MKFWQGVAVIAVLVCMTRGATEEEQQVVHFHPITSEEYEAILGLTNGAPVISEARLIASGLAAIKSLAAGITTGFAAAWWLPTLLSSFGATAPKETETNIDTVPDRYPLCVIKPGYSAEDAKEPVQRRGSSKRRSGRGAPLPLAHCIVVVRQPEENSGVGTAIPQVENPWSYPPPYPHPRPVVIEKPMATPAAPANPATYPYYPYYPDYFYPSYNQKYSGYSQYFGHPEYYGIYPVSAPVAEASLTSAPPAEELTTEDEAEPPINIIERKKSIPHNTHKNLRHRSAPRPPYGNPLSPDYAHPKTRSKKKREEVATHPHPQNYAQISNYPGSGYEQTYYPQFNYQSTYPKVSYTHALPYPAPIYRQLITPMPTKKIASVDLEEDENLAEYIKVRNN